MPSSCHEFHRYTKSKRVCVTGHEKSNISAPNPIHIVINKTYSPMCHQKLIDFHNGSDSLHKFFRLGSICICLFLGSCTKTLIFCNPTCTPLALGCTSGTWKLFQRKCSDFPLLFFSTACEIHKHVLIVFIIFWLKYGHHHIWSSNRKK